MKITSIANAKTNLSAYIKESKNGPIAITRNGKLTAVLLSVEDEAELEHLLYAYSPKFKALLEKSRRQIARGEALPHDTFWENIEKDE